MLKSPFVLSFVFLLVICGANAKLPETAVVQQAYGEAAATIEDQPEVTAKAYFAIVLAAKPTAANRTELVDAVEATLRNDFSEVGISNDVEKACFFHFWQVVVAHFPGDEAFQTTLLFYEAMQLPWAQAQPKLLARGDAYALELGFNRLADSPEPSSATVPFVTAAAASMAKATPSDLNKFLGLADKEGYSEIIAAAQKRLLNDKNPEIQQLAATPAVRRIVLGQAVREIAAQYDLTTLEPPELEPWTVQGPGEIAGAFEKLKQMVEGNPMVSANHPQFGERIKGFDALIATYPNYGRIYEYKAKYLSYAGLKEEALLTQTLVMRMYPHSANSGYCSAQARYWSALGYRGQALVEAHRALKTSFYGYEGSTLLIFCEVAVAESLKVDGLVPAGWDALIAERLSKLEDQQGALVRNAKPLYIDAIRFWDKHSDFPRARAALARLKQSGDKALIAAHASSFAEWEKRWDKGSLAFYYGLPEAPQPHGTDLELAFHEGDLPRAWSIYAQWSGAEPRAVAPRLYGAAAFLDLGAPYLALALIEDGNTLHPTAKESQLLARIRAGCSARLGEPVAAALAYAQSGDGESLSTYWLQVFVEANQAGAYSRISNRALAVLSADQRDRDLLPWAWEIYAMTAPASAVDAWRGTLMANGGLPKAPDALSPGLMQGVVDGQRRLQVAWSDWQVAKGKVAARDWYLFAQLAAADGRDADAAFFAAGWLLGLSPEQETNPAEETQAKAWVVAYRDGTVPPGDFAESLLRNPCNGEAMVGAYEAARERGDMYAAAEFLRQIFMAYADDRIDLLAACNVAAAAADWELLLSVSQSALARRPSDESRSWYSLALVACDKSNTAMTIQNQIYDGAFRALAREIDGWSDFSSKGNPNVGNMAYGEYAELHGVLRDAMSLRRVRQGAAKEAATSNLYKSDVPKFTAAVDKHLLKATPSVRAHVAFQLGDIDEATYLAGQSTPDDRTIAQIFTILRRWKDGDPRQLTDDELVDIQSIMHDPRQHLRFRVMTYAMLRTAEILPDPRPLRASDPMYFERAIVGTQEQIRAGRLMQVNDAEELLRFLGGTSRLSFPNNKTVRTIRLPTPPPVLRLRIAPDLAEKRLSGLTSANFEKQMQEFGRVGLQPVINRAMTALRSDLATAGTAMTARWAALKKGGFRVWRTGEGFYLEDGTFADASMAVIQSHLKKYPVDAYAATYEARLLPLQFMQEYVDRLPANAREVISVGRQVATKSYQKHEDAGGSIFDASFDSGREVQQLFLKFPPGSEDFAEISKMLAKGGVPNDIGASLASAKRRRGEAIVAAEVRAENKKKFDQSMARGDLKGVGEAAAILGGSHYVQWIMKLPNARLDQLIQARIYSTNAAERSALNTRITKLQNDSWRPQVMTSTSTPAQSRGSSSGTSWSSFTSQMSAKQNASYEYQRARDAKNFVIRYRSDGSYSTH